jgi:hypothetical protein
MGFPWGIPHAVDADEKCVKVKNQSGKQVNLCKKKV